MLAKLAVDSDQALQPFAAVRKQVADFIVQSNTVAQASARHRGALARNLRAVPAVPRASSARRWNGSRRFADQTTPVFTDLKVAAPGINKAFTHLPAFSKSSTKFFKSLGKTVEDLRPGARPRCSRCSTAWRRSAPPPSRSRPTPPNCSRACATPAGSSGSWTSSSSAPARPTATTRSATSCAPKGSAPPASPTSITPASACQRETVQHDRQLGARRATARRSAARRQRRTSVVMARTLAVLKGATPAEAIAEIPGLDARPRRRARRARGAG